MNHDFKANRVAAAAAAAGVAPATDRPSAPLVQGQAPEYVAPRDDVERHLTEMWGVLFARPRVGTRDSFLSLGGESMLAAEVVTRIRAALGVDVPVRCVLVGTIETVAEEIRTRRQAPVQP